eukprot:m.179293 g.179293  ORF g.179293 m.179293 type:complete len:700 (+) comp14727_c0_seq1:272-2371(+)
MASGGVDFNDPANHLTASQWMQAIGMQVYVKDFGPGTLEYYGPLEVDGPDMTGVALKQPKGTCSGENPHAKKMKLFACKPDHGVIVPPNEIMLLDNWNAAKARELEKLMKATKRKVVNSGAGTDVKRTSPRPGRRFDEPTQASKGHDNTNHVKVSKARLARIRAGEEPGKSLRKTRVGGNAPMTTTSKATSTAKTTTKTKRSSGTTTTTTVKTKAPKKAAPSTSRVAAARTAPPRAKAERLTSPSKKTSSSLKSPTKRPSSSVKNSPSPKSVSPKGTPSPKRSSPKEQRASSSSSPQRRSTSPKKTSTSSPAPSPVKRSSSAKRIIAYKQATGSARTSSASSPPKRSSLSGKKTPPSQVTSPEGVRPPRLHPFLDKDEVQAWRAGKGKGKAAASTKTAATKRRSVRRSLSGSSMKSTATESSTAGSPPGLLSPLKDDAPGDWRDSTPDALFAYQGGHTDDGSDSDTSPMQRPRSRSDNVQSGKSGDLMTMFERATVDTHACDASTSSASSSEHGGSPLKHRTGSLVPGSVAQRRATAIAQRPASADVPRRKTKTSLKSSLSKGGSRKKRDDIRFWRGGDPKKQLAEQQREETRRRVALEQEIREREQNDELHELVYMASSEQRAAMSTLEEKWAREDAERQAKKERERLDREIEAAKHAQVFEQRALERRATLLVTRASSEDDVVAHTRASLSGIDLTA